MKISTKGRYGVRIMLELALYYNEKLLTVRQISQKQNISEKYAEQIIGLLHKAGLVHSYRGAQGGYKLAHTPNSISVGQILQVTDSSMNLMECMSECSNACPLKNDCVTTEIWRSMKQAMDDIANHTTLADLVNRYNDKTRIPMVG